MEELARQVIKGATDSVSKNRQNQLAEQILTEFNKPGETVQESVAKTTAIYGLLSTFQENYKAVPPIYYCGRLKPAEADKGILRRRNLARDEFVKTYAAVILQAEKESINKKQEEKSAQQMHSSLAAEDGAGTLVISTGRRNDEEANLDKRHQARFLTLDGSQTQLPEPLRNLAEEIIADLGHIPNDYISAANGLAGQAAPPAMDAGSPSGGSLLAPLTYDEWDFRRNGFRKDWCILTEKKLQPVKGTFIDSTLVKYQGQLKNLKKQFEMLRSTERFTKRQRDGNDLDLDAIIESISDTKAGRPPSERLFIKLQRDERDIAVFFLVDMSSSTEGWVGKALKEALILMGESLQVLGDRFAICGFSGMRRTRCDFYQIKDFDEPYNEEIKGRIAAISPQEYTRMGPPLRHAVELLQNVEARVRLLITLSDGKPEDYDDYKGEYAIEDTRHALIEAKASGIHPFCITIDKQAHDYISHMYGEVNYIFVDEVRKLPMRLPQIYRILTT
jgi:nitric oxide reductase NorD protein